MKDAQEPIDTLQARLAQLEASLQRFLRFYNEQRPHHGYRLRGRTPGELLRGAQR